MKISVVTAVWNRASTIGDSLTSLSGQTYQNVEHVVQDGASSDGTLDIIAAHPFANRQMVSEKDGGIYDALNRGFARASGDVVGLLHSDDYFADADVLARVAEAFGDPAVQAVYGDLDYVAAEDTDRVVRHWQAGDFAADKLAKGWMPPHPTLFLRRSVIEECGLFDTSFRIAADYDAILRYFSQPGFDAAYIPHVLVKMRLGGASNASLRHILRKSLEDHTALRKNKVGGMGTLAAKNLQKIPQFLRRSRAEA